jgi:hypothetical protein
VESPGCTAVTNNPDCQPLSGQTQPLIRLLVWRCFQIVCSVLDSCLYCNIILHVAITSARVTGRVSCAIRPSLQHHVPIKFDSAHAALQPRQKRPYMYPSYRGAPSLRFGAIIELPWHCVNLLVPEYHVEIVLQAAAIAACRQTDSKLCVVSRVSAFATWKTKAQPGCSMQLRHTVVSWLRSQAQPRRSMGALLRMQLC